jgi:hypothetical protein
VFSGRAMDRSGKDVWKMCQTAAELKGSTSAGRRGKS